MKATEPLALHHSWPLIEVGQRFDLGWVHALKATPAASQIRRSSNGSPIAGSGHGIGTWAYDLRHDVLEWSPAVYEVIGFPRGDGAIRHRPGFTLDVELQPVGGAMQWMRLTAIPVCDGDRVVALRGSKQDISHEYA